MKKVIYTKYANERAERFSVRTDMIKSDEKRYIVKTAEHPSAEAHISNMCQVYKALCAETPKYGFRVAPCRKEKGSIIFDYITGKNMEEELDELLREGKTELVEKELLEYCQQVRTMFSIQPFQVTEEFKSVFGDVDLPEGLLSAEVNNIDMVVGNIILHGTEKYIIDYEWSFFFPIPSSFIIYRILHYYLYANEQRKELRERGLFEKCDISEKEMTIYKEMEKHFQHYIVGERVPMREMYPSISPGTFQIIDWANIEEERRKNSVLQVFFSTGKGYLEEESLYFKMKNYEVEVELEIPNGTTNIRIDPGATYTLCQIEKLCFDNGKTEIEEFNTNGYKLQDNYVVFEKMDPQLTLDVIPTDVKKVTIQLKIIPLEETILKLWAKEQKEKTMLAETIRGQQERIGQMQQQCEQKQQEIERMQQQCEQKEQEKLLLNEKIHAMQGTKVWKAYEKYRKLVGRK